MGIFEVKKIGEPEKWLMEAASVIGLDFSRLAHEVTTELVDHSLKRHGNPEAHGAATVVNADFDLIPGIVKAPDYAL